MIALVARAASSLALTLAVIAALAGAALALAIAAFGFTVAGAVSLYFVVWWTVLFAVLPLGVRSQEEVGDVVSGSDPGSPAAPHLRERAIWTTIASAPVFALASGLLPYAGL